jgi:hypothetical protein
MSDSNILFLIKFFTQEIHADRLMKGELFMNRLSYFKQVEDDSLDGRLDHTEAVAMWWQPHDVQIEFENFPHLKITSKDLAGPVSTSFDFHNHLHLFCMYALTLTGFPLIDGRIDLASDEEYAVRKQFEIDPRCFEFGPYAVIVPGAQFRDKVLNAARGRYAPSARSVRYYDERLFHGAFKSDEIPFTKQLRFKHQQEFRFCINTGTTGTSPLLLNIGDISHMSCKIKSSELNRFLQSHLRFEPAPT